MYCKFCNETIKEEDESRHSLYGRHMIPFVFVHEECHRKIHKLNNGNWYYSKWNQAQIKEYEGEKDE